MFNLRKLLWSAMGGMALFVGCATGPRVDLVKLNDTLDDLVHMISYHNGRILSEHREYEDAVEYYTTAIKKKDNAMYRWARFSANMSLISQNPDSRDMYAQRCITDAEKYIEFLPNAPDGYAAKAFAKLLMNYQENAKDAEELLFKALTLTENGQEFKHFKKVEVSRVFAKLYRERTKYIREEY